MKGIEVDKEDRSDYSSHLQNFQFPDSTATQETYLLIEDDCDFDINNFSNSASFNGSSSFNFEPNPTYR